MPDEPVKIPVTDSSTPPAQDSPPKAPEPTPAEQRLQELLGIQEDLTKKVDQQGAFNDQVMQALSSLTQKIDSLGSAPKAPPAAPSYTPPAQPGTQPPAAQTGGQDLQAIVQKAIADAFAPQQAEQARLQKHRDSFQKVAQQYPELTDASSRDAQIFNQLYRTRQDLAGLDDAPSIIAGLTRDIRSQERARARQVEQQKTQAGFPIGRGRGVEVDTEADVRTLQEQYNQLRDRGRRVPLTRREIGDFINLSTALQHLGIRL